MQDGYDIALPGKAVDQYRDLVMFVNIAPLPRRARNAQSPAGVVQESGNGKVFVAPSLT